MTARHDPELDDVLQDEELRRLGLLLGSATRSEPPLDEAFRSALRRNLMNQAEGMAERRAPWWRLRISPPVVAWAGAAVGLVLIAAVVVYNQVAPLGTSNQIVISSPLDGGQAVQLQQPIKVAFNQPMNHAATEAAVQVTPATTVTFSWQDNTLSVLPTSGTLAPNTQYQVTIGSTAQTAGGVALPQAQTITFVTQTQTPPTPSPTPHPSPTPGSLVTGEKHLAPLGSTAQGQAGWSIAWSADSSRVYVVTGGGALQVVPANGGDVTVIAADGVTSASVSPAGDRLAYVRGGKLETLNLSDSTTSELAPSPRATLAGWAGSKVVWAAGDGVYTQKGSNGWTQLAPLPTEGTVAVVSISPDGSHAAYTQDQKLMVLDLTSGKSTQLGQDGATFQGWSPGSSKVMFSVTGGIAVADLNGNKTATLPPAAPSWSSKDAILLGGDTALSQVPPDGSSVIKLADGTYNSPVWAPDGMTFAFVRGTSLWVAAAPKLPALPSSLDQAKAVVDAFMQARLNNHPDEATALLDDSGKLAYAPGGLSLTISGDPSFSRYYILTQEITATTPDTAKFVVRLVLSHSKLDVSNIEETLTVVRNTDTDQFVIDQATSGAHRDLGKGAEVVGVEVGPSSIQVTFDSDLDPTTVVGGVFVVDSHGKRIDANSNYDRKTVTISGLDLKPGAQYKLVVSTSVRDVLGHKVASEYDLVIVGPAPDSHESVARQGTPSPSPSPSPSPNPSPGG